MAVPTPGRAKQDGQSGGAAMMNGWDAMLAWLSLQGGVPWQVAKAASQRLSAVYYVGADDLPRDHARRWVEPLIQLGHAEFHQQENSVIASPSGIMWSSLRGRGILYGCWTDDRLRAIESDGCQLQREDPGNGPTCRTVSQSINEPKAMEQLAADLKVWLAVDCGEKILAALPDIGTILEGLPEDQSSGDGWWQTIEFQDGRCRWEESRNALVRPGIYRRLSGSIRRVLVTTDNRRFSLPTPNHQRAAIWTAAPAADWNYDFSGHQLLIPTGLPPLPLLVSRGLTGASGYRPFRIKSKNREWWCYQFVTPDCARKAAEIMRRRVGSETIAVAQASELHGIVRNLES